MIYLMTAKSNEVQKARWSLIQQTFDQIFNIPSYSDFRSNTFCAVAHLGLQLKAEEEELLDGDDWYDPECKERQLEKVRVFLIKHIR